MDNQRRRVLISCAHLQRHVADYADVFARHGIEVEAPVVVQQLSEQELLGIIDGFDGVIAGDDEFSAAVLERAKSLKVLVKWGIGVDGIDLAAAKRLGIPVHNTPGVFGDEVADVAIGYMIMLTRQLHKLDRAVRHGQWPKIQGTSLSGKTIGIIGVGDIGQAICRRATALGMRIIGYDVADIPQSVIDSGVGMVEFAELIRSADIISLSCALSATNRHMISEQEFKNMRDGAYLVNVSRGSLIDEDALVEALKSGKLAGAALDVFEVEPLPMQSPLLAFDNCIFGTHNSSNTLEAVQRVNDKTVQVLIDGLEGRLA